MPELRIVNSLRDKSIQSPVRWREQNNKDNFLKFRKLLTFHG